MKAILHRPKERPSVIEVENSLVALQTVVGGYIETVTVTEDVCLICNEEGILLRLEPQKILGRTFFGNVLLVGTEGDEFTDIPDEWADLWIPEEE